LSQQALVDNCTNMALVLHWQGSSVILQVHETKFPNVHSLETWGTDRSIAGTIRSYI